MVIRDFSPPKSSSASASAVSVLPVPLVPTSRNTPCGPFSGARPVLAARRRCAMAFSAASWPTTRFARLFSRLSSSVCSSFINEESGTPVQSAITVATVRVSTSSPSSGLPWCTTLSCSCNAAISAWREMSCRQASKCSVIFSSSPYRVSSASSSRMMRISSCSIAVRRSAWVRFPTAISFSSACFSMFSAVSCAFSRVSGSGIVSRLMRTRAEAVSSRSTALSGSWRPVR